MRKVGIDCRLYFQTGVGVYLRNLLYHLEKQPHEDITFYLYVMDKDASRIQFQNEKFVKRVTNCRWHSVKEQLFFAQTLNKDDLDLMHFTYFSYPVLYGKKFIATVHDVTPFLFKTGKASTKNFLYYAVKHAFFRFIFNNQLDHAQAIITPTHTVKKQITSLFGEKYGSKITPLHEGVNFSLVQAKPNANLKEKYPKPFLIYVGNFYPHKNIERLIRAFSKINQDVQLILIGPNDFFSKRLSELILELKQEKRIFFYHNPTPDDLVFFYKNAEALVHPSLSEGFGLPIVEAAYFNLPIIASNIEIFKELLDDRYIPFHPLHITDIQDKITYALINRVRYRYDDMVSKYSFGEMTKGTLHIYRKTLDSNSARR